MSKTVLELGRQQRKEVETEENQWWQFPVGTKVKVVSPCVDFSFFYGETGTVSKSSSDYLGIEVCFEKPRRFTDGTVQKSFNFAPKDILRISHETGFIVDLRGL